MVKLASVVIVDSDPSRRNQVTRAFFANSHHVEPYDSFDELRAYWPDAGMIVVNDNHGDRDAVREIFDLMLERVSWLPVTVYAVKPELSRVVDVILMGAMDYLEWPFTDANVIARLRVLASRKQTIVELRRRAVRSQQRVDLLSPREREVLFCLAKGASNKSAAVELNISPRTIEIHRANMMSKLGVAHLSEALSIALYADLSNFTNGDQEALKSKVFDL